MIRVLKVVGHSNLLAGIGDLRADEHYQLPGCVVVAQGPGQDHGPLGVVVIGRQRDESLVCGTELTKSECMYT